MSRIIRSCHIAAWAVEGEMKPAHGPAFKGWGKRIMAARKDIKVTTKHSYEIGVLHVDESDWRLLKMYDFSLQIPMEMLNRDLR